MALIVKIIVILGIGTLLSGGGILIHKSLSSNEPRATTLSSSGNTTDSTKLKGNEENRKKLVEDKAENEKGGNGKYKRLSSKFSNDNKSNLDSHFQSVDKGYSSTEETSGSQKALNKACLKSYDKTKTDLEATNSKLKSNIEEFCTKGINHSLIIPTS